MADEITISASVRVTNGNFNLRIDPGALTIDQATGGGGNPGTVSIATSETTIDTSALTSEGYLFLRNLDATNFITFGPDSTGQVDLGKLKPGEFALLRLKPAVTLKATADTAACLVQAICIED